MRSRVMVAAVVIVIAMAFVGPVLGQQQVLVGGTGFQSTPVLRATTSAEGQPISFPTFHNQWIMNYFTLTPGGESPRHSHPVPGIVFVIEGSLTIEADGNVPRVYTAGQGFVESVNVLHKAVNRGTTLMRAIVVFAGEEGKPFTVAGP